MYERQMFQMQKQLKRAGLPTVEVDGIKWYVAGGACRAVFANEMISDLDIYFESPVDFIKFKARHWGTAEKRKEICFETDNALSINHNGARIQLIKKFHGLPQDLLQRFDYTICQCAYVPYSQGLMNVVIAKEQFVMTDSFLEHLSLRILVFNVKGDHPINSLIRANKFLGRGYRIPAVELVKLALRIKNLEMKTYKDLKEELEGIDTILLKDLTDSLIEKKDVEYDFNAALGLINDYLEQKFKELSINPEGYDNPIGEAE